MCRCVAGRRLQTAEPLSEQHVFSHVPRNHSECHECAEPCAAGMWLGQWLFFVWRSIGDVFWWDLGGGFVSLGGWKLLPPRWGSGGSAPRRPFGPPPGALVSGDGAQFIEFLFLEGGLAWVTQFLQDRQADFGGEFAQFGEEGFAFLDGHAPVVLEDVPDVDS